MNHIFELAINQAKSGQYHQFLQTRTQFVDVLSREKDTLNEGKWKPFFTVADLPLDDILVGMTQWSSMQGFGETASRLMPQPVTQHYFASFNPLVYLLLEPVDGQVFDMESIKTEGSVVEFAVRAAKTADAFGDARNDFFQSLENHQGYRFAREFKVYQLDQNSMPQLLEDVQAVVIVWDNMANFQAAITPVFSSAAYQRFAANIEVSAYFATLPTT